MRLTSPSKAAVASQSVGWAVVVLLLLLGASVLAGAWAGNRWAQGRQAIKDKAELRAYIGQLQADIKTLQEHSADAVLAYDQAATQLNQVAEWREHDREQLRKHDQAQRAELAKLLEDRPDLRDGRAGDGVLQHWNKSNAGPAAAPATTPDAAQPGAAVPGAATGSGRPLADPAGQPRRGGGPVSRLPQRQRPADSGRADLAGVGVGLVLHRAGSDGHQVGGLQR